MSFLFAAALALLLCVAPAAAATLTNERPFVSSFDGADSSIGPFTRPGAVDIDTKSGAVYVINLAGTGKGPTGYGPGPTEWDDERVLCRFDAEGKAVPFTAGSSAGKSCLDGKDIETLPEGERAFGVEGFFGTGAFTSDIAVDNSGGLGGPGEGEQGRIYLSEDGGPIHAFDPDGEYRWTLARTVAEPCGVAVDPEGDLWVGNGYASGEARFEALEFDASGAEAPTEPSDSIKMANPDPESTNRPCRLAFDQGGEVLYVGLAVGLPSGLDKYVEGAFHSTFGSGYRFDVAVDGSKASGHVFAVETSSFTEHEPCAEPECPGKEVPGNPFGRDLIGNARGIAYNPSLDRVYVSDLATNTVKVFGPYVKEGTAPDVAILPSSGIGREEFTANGTINPLSLPHSYHFEWKPCGNAECTGPGDANWGAAQSSPPQGIEPTDSEAHEVSLAITEYEGAPLKSNTDYQVRLVGTNAENGLSAYSAPDTFKTLPPPPPEVRIDSIAPITTESAHVEATINPREDAATWRVLRSAKSGATQAECEALPESAFTVGEEGTIPPKEPGEVPIKVDLEGLLAAQTYCIRVSATNENPEPAVADRVIQTLAIPPADASAAFAAPRTATSARINARVNPQGEADFTYRFEWSEDEGKTWEQQPLRESSTDAREPIVIAEELTGLTPGATYRHRLGLLENHGAEGSGGKAASLGEERTFATRSVAEIEALDPPSCPNDAVRTAQRTAYLASCRAVELVNNPDKGNQNVVIEGPATVRDASPMTADGKRVLWTVVGGAPGAPNGALASFLAERTPAGWRSHSAAPPAEEQVGGGDFLYKLNGASADFGAFVFGARGSTGFAAPPPPTIVRVRDGVQDILKATAVAVPSPIYETSVNLSDDGEHVVFIDSTTKQLEDIGAARVGPPEVPGEILSLLPPPGSPLGVPVPGGSESECGLDFKNGFSFGSTVSALIHPGYHWIATADASRVYFRVQPDPPEPLEEGEECTGPYALYVHDRDAATTTPIDYAAPEFIRATPDGRAAYLRTTSKLDPVDTNSGADLYRWDETAGESSCLTCVVPDAQVSSDGVLVSEDFSHLYFLSQEQLLEGLGKAGGDNLYALSGGELRFVATVDRFVLNDARLSSDGNVLLFGERAGPQLTADQIAAGTAQLYRYDDRDASIECLSCERQGVTAESFGTSLLGGGSQFVLSGDGTTAAFATPQALTPRDVNNDTDIYEWRSGAQLLISDGVTDFQTEFAAPRVAAIDEDGSDVLFALVPPGGSLTGFERDSVMNLYDARIGGGFAPPSPLVRCVEDSCQGPLVAPPPLPAGGGRFQGRGNVSEPPNCGRPAHRAQRLSRHARRLARAARHTHSGRRSRNLRRRANHLAKRAKRLSRSAKRCRKQARANGRAQR